MSSHKDGESPLGDLSIPAVEDVVDYRLYCDPPLPHLEAHRVRLDAMMVLVKEIILDYIWQDEPFSLHIIEGLCSSSQEPPKPVMGDTIVMPQTGYHFYGSTRFGDNLDDEWIIVHILLEITRKFTDMSVSVVDNDGEFLLIEAANHLPNWLKPETALHRVWLHHGEVHIIPITLIPSIGLTQKDAISNALHILAKSPEATLASEKIRNSIGIRVLASSSQAVQNSTQWAACKLPINVAYLLKYHPEWVSKAVTAFYHRDPMSLRNASKFAIMGITPKVNIMVRFTRCLYAQLASQHWVPPRAYGVLPNQTRSSQHFEPVTPSNDVPKTQLFLPSFAFELGAKLACGFEILYLLEKESSDRTSATQVLNHFNFAQDPQWNEYNIKLNSMGYFRGLPETHIKYQDLEKKAKQKFLTMHPEKAKSLVQPSLCAVIDSLLAHPELQDEQTPSKLFPDSLLFPSTFTDWMNISPEEVDRIILERQVEQEEIQKDKQQRNKATQDEPDEGSAEKKQFDIFDNIAKDMERFMSMKSGLDGVDLSEPKERKAGTSASNETNEPQEANVETDDEDSDFYDTSDSDERIDLEDLDMDEDGFDVDEKKLRADRMEMLQLMREMDAELLESELSKSFERVQRNPSDAGSGDNPPSLSPVGGTDDDELEVDTNINLVKNFIESYASQHGVAGPVSALLGQLEQFRQNQK